MTPLSSDTAHMIGNSCSGQKESRSVHGKALMMGRINKGQIHASSQQVVAPDQSACAAIV
jgi:hypothetical protein